MTRIPSTSDAPWRISDGVPFAKSKTLRCKACHSPPMSMLKIRCCFSSSQVSLQCQKAARGKSSAPHLLRTNGSEAYYFSLATRMQSLVALLQPSRYANACQVDFPWLDWSTMYSASQPSCNHVKHKCGSVCKLGIRVYDSHHTSS